MAAFIQVRGLVRQFPGVRALDGADLDVREGEILGLLGKNGAGKSSLIKVLAGLEQPDSGSLHVEGTAVRSGYGPRNAHELGLAFVHQELANVPELTVAENIMLGTPYPRRAGVLVDHRRMYRDASALLDKLGIEVEPHAYVGSLSPTAQRLVMIARALHHDARVLFLDEPSVSFTDSEIDHLHRLLRGLRDNGHGIVYISHRIAEITALTDRIAIMQDGRVILDRPTRALDAAAIIAVISGKPANAARPRPSPPKPRSPGAVPAEPLLRVRHLNAPSRVHDVSFDLYPGEVLGLVGLVGSGRSEVAQLIFGADRPTSGTIEVEGRPVRFAQPAEAVAAGIGLVPEDRRHKGLVLDFSVRANITLSSLRKHRRPGTPLLSRRRETQVTRRLTKELVLKGGPETPVRTLSGGNQQKAVVGRWLEAQSRILLVDEPTQGVDVGSKAEIFRLLQRLAAEGRGVLVISSDFSELVEVCHRVVGLREGRTTGELAGDQITEDALVRLAYADPMTAVGQDPSERTGRSAKQERQSTSVERR